MMISHIYLNEIFSFICIKFYLWTFQDKLNNLLIFKDRSIYLTRSIDKFWHETYYWWEIRKLRGSNRISLVEIFSITPRLILELFSLNGRFISTNLSVFTKKIKNRKLITSNGPYIFWSSESSFHQI
jgi:hypothetical protein